MRAVLLSELFPGQPAVAISGIALNSKLVQPGDLYVALPGQTTHGANFAEGARTAGAVAVLTDPAGAAAIAESAVPVVVVEDPRHLMASVAATIYGRPAESMAMLAVTGTNGKTTTGYLLEAGLGAAGQRAGMIGTIGFMLDRQMLESVRTTVTTPESPDLQALLAVMAEREAKAVVMEVSSHALALGRADAITFDVAGFTNFGRDHMDFHGTEAAYFAAKAQLFTAQHTRHAVINVDDPRGLELVEQVRSAGDLGLSTTSLHPGADFYAKSIEVLPGGSSRVELVARGTELTFVCALPGEFNVRNAITALAMLEVIGIDLEQAAAGLADAQVPGRMQRVELGPDAPVVYVDFAHTPQAVTAAVQSLGAHRRIVVLGCGGDRDQIKRGPMGAAAASEADVLIVTDDNPRTEDPATIRDQVLAGAREAKAHRGLGTQIIDGGDRRSAIRLALELATAADVVAVLGKGHENGQEIGGQVMPFSDPAVIGEEWARTRGTA